MIKIQSAEYTGTVYEKLPDLPEVAFAGRSNAGKSSLINALLNRNGLVRVSKQPGKTRNINFFKVEIKDEPSLYFVDLPGYGYAQVCHEMKDAWEKLAGRYFDGNQRLKLLYVLIDIRRDLREDEYLTLKLAEHSGGRAQLVATKADRLNQGERAKRLKELEKQAGHRPLAVSSTAKTGLDEIWAMILDAIRA